MPGPRRAYDSHPVNCHVFGCYIRRADIADIPIIIIEKRCNNALI
jgi:hypothetical protein